MSDARYCTMRKKIKFDAHHAKKIIIENITNPQYVKSLDRLTPDQLMDLYTINYGFDNITELDSIVIRGDVLVERAIRSLAAAIANNPIPEDMSAAAIKSFIRLMEPPEQIYLAAVKSLNIARNLIAHEMHSNYSEHLSHIYEICELIPTGDDALDLKASIIVILAHIFNRREHLLSLKNSSSQPPPFST